MAENKQGLPLWLTNLLLFTLLTLSAVSYFFWQIHQAREDFLTHVRAHVQQVARVIQSGAGNAMASQTAAERLLETLLGNTARFVNYLNDIEPFTAEELSAFARESGLVGILITGSKGALVDGFPRPRPMGASLCKKKTSLEHGVEGGVYLFSWPRPDGPGCVVLGMRDKMIAALHENLGPGHVMKTVSQLPGIHSVRMESPDPGKKLLPENPSVAFKTLENKDVAIARLPFQSGILSVGVNTGHLDHAIHRLWRDFFIFGAAFALLGICISLILYGNQSSHLAQVKSYERHISKEREDAALGRAAAAIAHEIRNPLNALGMGLQRLQLEGKELTPDHRHLVMLLTDAVGRADASVTGLLNYARPPMPNREPVRIDRLFQKILALYRYRLTELKILVDQRLNFKETISGDPELLGQVIENLLLNAMEAQPHGGFIHVTIGQNGKEAYLGIRNGGLTLPEEKANQILEPYFTTKAQGTGLGLTIAQRIVQAHKGRIDIAVPEPGALEITVYLPMEDNPKPLQA
jgi:two-component system, NtrC family, sensor histidine kinase HydH